MNEKCAKCGHIRYDDDQFDGRCDECEAWAQLELYALRERVRELEARLAVVKEAIDRAWAGDDAAKSDCDALVVLKRGLEDIDRALAGGGKGG